MPARSDAAREERIRRIALLGAVSFFLAAVEYAIPKPLPYLRLGIANLPLLLGTAVLPFGDYFLLALVKWAGMGFVSGTLFSFVSLLSLAGTLSASLTMYAFARLSGGRSSFVAPGIIGACASNAVQLAVASFAVFGSGAALIAPPFLAMGLATGTALGLFANLFARSSRWFASIAPGPSPGAMAPDAPAPGATAPSIAAPGPDAGAPEAIKAPDAVADKAKNAARRRERRAERWERALHPGWLAASGIVASTVLAFHPAFAVKLALFLLFLALAIASGRKPRILASVITTLSIVAFNLLAPAGRVLASIGSFAITETALMEGLERALVFEGLLFASLATIRPGLRLPGIFGRIISSSLSAYPLLLSSGASRRMRKAKGRQGARSPARAAVAPEGAGVRGKMAAVVALVDEALFSLARDGALDETRVMPKEGRGISGILLPIAMALAIAALGMMTLPGV